MPKPSLIAYLNPWKLKRERKAACLAALRARDGDSCARCRRPMRFDLTPGHDQGFKVEPVTPGRPSEPEAIDNLMLCHPRCNPAGKDHTGVVTARVRQKNEAALFAKSREKTRESRAA